MQEGRMRMRMAMGMRMRISAQIRAGEGRAN